jgi:hypothetical protein
VAARGNPLTASTSAQGEYHHLDVGDNEYRMEIRRVGFLPWREVVKVKGADLTVNVRLWRDKFNAEYVGGVADRYARLAQAGGRPRVYGSLWQDMRRANVAPESKRLLVQGIREKDREAPEAFTPFRDYLAAKPEDIRAVAVAFADALRAPKGKNGAGIPTKDELDRFNLGQEVMTDCVLYQLRTAPVPESRKEAFLTGFHGAWRDDPVVKDVMRWHAKDRDKTSALISPP